MVDPCPVFFSGGFCQRINGLRVLRSTSSIICLAGEKISLTVSRPRIATRGQLTARKPSWKERSCLQLKSAKVPFGNWLLERSLGFRVSCSIYFIVNEMFLTKERKNEDTICLFRDNCRTIKLETRPNRHHYTGDWFHNKQVVCFNPTPRNALQFQ